MNRRQFIAGSATCTALLAAAASGAMALARGPGRNAQSDSVARLYRDAIVIDALGSPFSSFPANVTKLSAADVQQVKSSGITAINATISSPTYDETIHNIAIAQALPDKYPDTFLLVRRHSDIARAKREGKMGIILGFQYTGPFEEDLSRLELFHGLGVRIIQMSYNLRSLLGDGCLEPANAGLSTRGREAVARMNELGIAVDLSHCGQQTTADGIAVSKKPVLITHSGCNGVFRHPRNKDDREMRALVDRGGVMGVYFMPYLCASPKVPTADDVLQHIAYALKVCGEDHVGIGTDNSVEAVVLNDEQRKQFEEMVAARKKAGISAPGEDRMPFVPELNGPDKLRKVAEGLAKRGYGSSVIAKVLGGNFHRVLADIWGTA
ncbi:MAG: dipeptidase [Terriglobales bacterium]